MNDLRYAVAGIRAGLGKCLFLISLGTLAGCASFDAHPAPVLNRATVVNVANIDLSDALHDFYATDDSERGGLTPEGFRNRIIGQYLLAADYQFNDFRRQLSRQNRGSTFGLDVGALGFAGGASVAGARTANILSAIAAGLTGTRTALSRDVFFDRALPALFAAMDAVRTEIRTTIVVNMRRSGAEYPLPLALADLAAYENAGSLDSAIERVTGDAVDRADEAQANYVAEVASYTGPPDAGVSDIRRRIRDRLLALSRANDSTTLGVIARNLGLTVPAGATADAIRILIQAKVRTTTDVAGTQQLARTIGVQEGTQ